MDSVPAEPSATPGEILPPDDSVTEPPTVPSPARVALLTVTALLAEREPGALMRRVPAFRVVLPV